MGYRVPLGPYHPAFEEGEYIELELEGEMVVDAEIKIGFIHRAIEKSATRRTFIKDLGLIERVCGICSYHHSWAYCLAVEKAAGLEVPVRAEYIRVLTGELERIHSHLMYLGAMAHKMGFDTLFMYTWSGREAVMDMLELFSGNRVNYAINTLGGVRRDLDEDTASQIRSALDSLEDLALKLKDTWSKDASILARTRNVGVITKEQAHMLSVVGPTARGSGIHEDIRKTAPYSVYPDLEFDMVVLEDGDVWSRTFVRVLETLESIRIARQVLAKIPSGPIKNPKPVIKIEPRNVMSRVEAPRGELIDHLITDGSDRPFRLKIRTPTLVNLPATEFMMRGCKLADAPVIVGHIDPCMSCMDR
ncbi:NADH dehydrogenase subunit D [Coprothermobacteraceae bacterium]|nr:NADH dehydrogenase subunit D [Coprothermobacteraceae bacterium]